MINLSAKSGQAQEAAQWLEKMINGGVEPDTVAYTAVVSAYAARGDAPGAVRWLRRMKDCNLEPDHIAYTAVIGSFAKKETVLARRRSDMCQIFPTPSSPKDSRRAPLINK